MRKVEKGLCGRGPDRNHLKNEKIWVIVKETGEWEKDA